MRALLLLLPLLILAGCASPPVQYVPQSVDLGCQWSKSITVPASVLKLMMDGTIPADFTQQILAQDREFKAHCTK